MNEKYPSSILVGLYTSLLIAFIYLCIRLISGGNMENLFLEMGAIFTLTILSITLILEFILYRMLKSINTVTKKEIKKLQQMEVFRREFLGDVSHELKTPIFAIEGFIETLLDGALEDPKVNRKFLEKTRKNAGRLSNLVQDILTISQIESGDLSMVMEDFSIYGAVEDVLDSLSYKFTVKGRNINCQIISEIDEDTLVYADPNRIDQVLRNLVDNAVKYGDAEGKIKVVLKDYEQGRILVQVIDNGQGISKKHLTRVFERFYRVDKSRSRERGGTGLGLAICKHFIEAHRESLWVESERGEGSTFQFTLQKVE